MTEELYLTARGRRISGWTEIEVTLRADGFPGEFDIAMSWKDPVTKGAVIAAAGDPCQVYLGSDLVISGYIDQDIGGGDTQSRSLRLTGRGKTQDLTDCGAEWATGQQIGGDALSISQKLAAVYGIEVVLANGASAGPTVTQWALNYGETPAAIIQRLAQNAGLLAYEDSTGRLLLANVGTTQAASGVVYGQNVEKWSVQHSMHERFSEIVCSSYTVDVAMDVGGSTFFDTQTDPNVPRHRRKYVFLESVAEDANAFAIRKAKWEVARRAGRSTVVLAQIDSWRDAAGALWAPNTLVPVSLPANRLGAGAMILAEVRFRRGPDGTHADLVLMPREAFTIEPISLLAINAADITPPNAQP
ncbi:phage baseplate assembly protein [Sphingomonas sp. TX0522]|uniref:phage baseplate assembly protein n=1 Tax=Sphingomonas sp. TX0522 TaxID=2479205 RepID=UPI0018DFEDD2|nr:hypothetical protein [Sphingomonas sp. TX0522]MBI0533259.1 phage tail protein [Sphingomonas sp. TX0522]